MTKLVPKLAETNVSGADSDSNMKSPVVASTEYNLTKISVPTVAPEAPLGMRTLIALSVAS